MFGINHNSPIEPEEYVPGHPIREIIEALPHGSGIDSDWWIEFNSRKHLVCSNSYHCMDENGMYNGWADFYLVIDLKHPENFKLHFSGRDGQYRNRKYMLRDYLEDTFAYTISEAEKKMIVPTGEKNEKEK